MKHDMKKRKTCSYRFSFFNLLSFCHPASKWYSLSKEICTLCLNTSLVVHLIFWFTSTTARAQHHHRALFMMVVVVCFKACIILKSVKCCMWNNSCMIMVQYSVFELRIDGQMQVPTQILDIKWKKGVGWVCYMTQKEICRSIQKWNTDEKWKLS